MAESVSGLISALCWVPKGAARPVPAPAPVSEEEMAAMRKEAAAVAADVLNQSEDEGSEDWETEDEEMDAEEAVKKAQAVAAALKKSSSGGGGKDAKVRGVCVAYVGSDLVGASSSMPIQL